MGLSDLLWGGGNYLPIFIFAIYIAIVTLTKVNKPIDKIVLVMIVCLATLFCLTRLLGENYEIMLSMSVFFAYLFGFLFLCIVLSFWTPKIEKKRGLKPYPLFWTPFIFVAAYYIFG